MNEVNEDNTFGSILVKLFIGIFNIKLSTVFIKIVSWARKKARR